MPRPAAPNKSPFAPNRALRLLTSLLLALLTACTSPTLTPRPTPALVRVAVTDITQPLLLDLAAAYARVNPDVVVAPSQVPQAGLDAQLTDGLADLVLTTAPDPKRFATPVGYVPFEFVVNPKNALKTIPLAVARDLLAGRLADWGSAGGAAWPVQVVTRGPGTSAEAALATTSLGPITVTTGALVAPTWAAMRQLVAANPGAVGYLIAPEADATVKPLPIVDSNGATLALRLLAAAQAAGDPGGAVRSFLAWAQSPAGQAAVAMRNEKLTAGGQK